MARARHIGPTGFTMLELLVVSMLMILLSLITAQMWRGFCAQAADLRQRTDTVQELQFALEGLCDDMGCVRWASPLAPDRLLISRDANAGQGEVLVEYFLDHQKLVRSDTSAGVAVPLADHVCTFLAQRVGDNVLRVEIAVKNGNTTRQATLLWSQP